MRIAALTTVADDSQTILTNGLAWAHTNGRSVISVLPLTMWGDCHVAQVGDTNPVSSRTPGPRRAGLGGWWVTRRSDASIFGGRYGR